MRQAKRSDAERIENKRTRAEGSEGGSQDVEEFVAHGFLVGARRKQRCLKRHDVQRICSMLREVRRARHRTKGAVFAWLFPWQLPPGIGLKRKSRRREKKRRRHACTRKYAHTHPLTHTSKIKEKARGTRDEACRQ